MVTFQIELTADMVDRAFDAALAAPCRTRGNFFEELRCAFKRQVEDIFRRNGVEVRSDVTLGRTNYLGAGNHAQGNPIIKRYKGGSFFSQHRVLDMEFCSKYGHDYYSLLAINYLEPSLCYLPSLYAFSRERTFSIGNILLCVGNGDYAVRLCSQQGINVTGYAYDIAGRKRKSYVCLFGVWFDNDLLRPIVARHAERREVAEDDLDEVRLGTLSFPIFYIDRIGGTLYSCSCFESQFEVDRDILRLLSHNEALARYSSNPQVVQGICHYCKGGVPKCEYGDRMYYSRFMQRYLPYHKLLSRMKYGRDLLHTFERDRYNEVENELREHFGYPRIGERWFSETMLYRAVCGLFAGKEVIHHYRGPELEGLEMDIWIPDIRLGIEYQGKQHYDAIEHWGGEEGLKKRRENDRRKKRLCREIGYHLLEFSYDEQLTEDYVEKRLSRFINGVI